jgi:hypothetical protein
VWLCDPNLIRALVRVEATESDLAPVRRLAPPLPCVSPVAYTVCCASSEIAFCMSIWFAAAHRHTVLSLWYIGVGSVDMIMALWQYVNPPPWPERLASPAGVIN